MSLMPTGRKNPGMVVAGIVLVVLFFSGKIVNLITDYFWFKEVNLLPVFLRELYTKLGCGFAAGVFAFIVISVNILIAARLSRRSEQFTGYLDPQTALILGKIPDLRMLLLGAAALVSFFIGSWAAGFWEVFLKASNAVPFAANDQLFGKNIGFYVFHLPFFRSIYFAAAATLVLSFAGAAVYYLSRQNLIFDGRRVLVGRPARTQLLLLLGLLAGSLYFLFQFMIYQMVTSSGTLVSGAGFAQIKAAVPILGALRYVSIVAAILIWITIFQRSLKLLGVAVALLLFGVALGFVGSVSLHKFVVGPDELTKEAPYIRWSIDNTRAAYGLDKIETKHFVPTGDMNAASLSANQPTVNNIRLWDHAPLLTTYSQLQEIRTYYEFLDVDNDRYTINGTYRQVMLSPR